MIRLALPKGRNLQVALAAFSAAGIDLGADDMARKLRLELPELELEVLLLKDPDVPLYVQHGAADFGVVGTDVLEEKGGQLLVPVRFKEGGCRLSLIGRRGAQLPPPGEQVRLATKYPNIARRVVEEMAWSAEILRLSGSIELAPLLDLAEVALDIVQTGRTIRENHLQELRVVRDVSPCLVLNPAAFQLHRQRFNAWIDALEGTGLVA